MVVWLAPGACNALGQVKLPVKTALAVAKLGITLAELRKPIEEVRVKLVTEFTARDEKGKAQVDAQGGVVLTDKEAFNKAFNELMDADCDTDLVMPKVKLPETVSATCDKCHHNMDRPLEIEPIILQQLEPFIEV